jgi:hypothetical protein
MIICIKVTVAQLVCDLSHALVSVDWITEQELCLAAGGLSSAEAVVKWLEVHPYLHAAQHSPARLPGSALQEQGVDAEQELERLRPLIHAVS